MKDLDIEEILENVLRNMENYEKTGEFAFFFAAKEQVETALKHIGEKAMEE